MKKCNSLFIIAACAVSCSSVSVSTDFDKSGNFSVYKTYALTREAEQLPVDDINRARIIRAVESQLAAKGFTKSGQPDVLIDLNLTAQQKQSATAMSADPYYAGRYGWGPGISTTSIHVENYVEGTLFVNMVDAAKQQLVWQGRAIKVIDQEVSPERREANINYAVKQIFTKYPPKK